MSRTPLARLREALLPDQDVRSALLTTYGLDPRFFEAEILPALLPTRLATDAQAGSLSAYLYDADEAAAFTPVEVLYDHLTGDGPQLLQRYRRVDLGSRAFHPKLLVAEYQDRLRVVVASANLTRPGWTSLFELLIVDDIVAGEPHAWAAGLRTFVEKSGAAAGGVGPAGRRLLALLEKVPATSKPSLHHSFDAALVDVAFPPVKATKIDVVSPFFEGEDGEGLFDDLRRRYPTARLALHLAASESEEGYVVHGPPDKLEELRRSGAELRLIRPLWDGDDDRAPAQRALHGKLMAVTAGTGRHVTIGSANATRAALLSPVRTGGNAELVATVEVSSAELARLLPPSFPADERVVFSPLDPSGEEGVEEESAARCVTSAVYAAKTRTLTLTLKDDSPPLKVSYARAPLGSTTGTTWSSAMPELLADAFVSVDAGSGPALVPFVVSDPEYLSPRGTPLVLDLEGLADLLAGRRQLVHPPGEELGAFTGSTPNGGATPIFGHGAIPWRRILAGLAGLQDDLIRQAPLPEAVRWTLANPLRLGGLRERFRAAHEAGRFEDGDLAFALYETGRSLRAAEHAPAIHEDSAALIGAELADVGAELDTLLGSADPKLRQQISIMKASESDG